jgi:hypothetical protein
MNEQLISGPLYPDEQLIVDSFKMFIRENQFNLGLPVQVAKSTVSTGKEYQILFAKSHPCIMSSAKRFHQHVPHPKHGRMKNFEEVWDALLEDFPMRINLLEALVKLVNSTGGDARSYFSNGSYWVGNKKWSLVWQDPENPFMLTVSRKHKLTTH